MMMICHPSNNLLTQSVASDRRFSVRHRSRSKSVAGGGRDISKLFATSPVEASVQEEEEEEEGDAVVVTSVETHVVPAASMPRLQLGQMEVDTLGPPLRAPPKPPTAFPRLSMIPQALPAVCALSIEPNRAAFTTEGGLSKHILMNASSVRLAIKVRCSNNHYFRVNPVFSFLDNGMMKVLEVIRLQGGEPKKDLVQLVYVVCRESDTLTDARQLFGPCARSRSLKVSISTI